MTLSPVQKRTIASVIPLFVFVMPIVVFAQSGGLVPCGNSTGPNTDECTFQDLIVLANKVIDFLILNLAAPLAGVVAAIAGVMMFTAGGNEERLTKAKSLLWSAVLGFIIALSAWLVIKAIVAVFIDIDVSFYIN